MSECMAKILYAVIILNYNTIDDAIAAAESVKNAAETSEFMICIADGGSTKEYDKERCKNFSDKNICTICLEKNGGYAWGNNQAIDFVKEKYTPQYYVIMNPDVLVLEKGTIEGMINRIREKGDDVVGGQPLVWNCNYGDNAEMQQNIRRVPNFVDVCILSNLLMKIVFYNRYKDFTYMRERPYNREICYQVPSGAFFVISASTFETIGLFDTNTFLYYEEYILGKKLDKIGKKMLFMPRFKVRHEHGKSTGNNRYRINKFAVKCGRDARDYYAKKYLKCNKFQMLILTILSKTDMPLRYCKALLNEIRRI